MISVTSATGEVATVRIEPNDTIREIAASTHYTERELCEVIEKMVKDDMNGRLVSGDAD